MATFIRVNTEESPYYVNADQIKFMNPIVLYDEECTKLWFEQNYLIVKEPIDVIKRLIAEAEEIKYNK